MKSDLDFVLEPVKESNETSWDFLAAWEKEAWQGITLETDTIWQDLQTDPPAVVVPQRARDEQTHPADLPKHPHHEVLQPLQETNDEVLRLKDVSAKYERREGRWRFKTFWALRDINLTLYRGESLGVIGHNGAGKSTLLRVLAGIYKADRGEVIKHKGVSASLIAVNVGFSPHLTGRENVVLNALFLGLSKQEAQAIIPSVKAYSGLGEFFEQPLITYSTGMRSRLGFSIAHHARPDIILIDEALGAGDKDFKEKSQKAIEEKILDQSSTVVLVSHSVATLRKLCTRVLWLDQGRTVRVGDAEDVLDAYEKA